MTTLNKADELLADLTTSVQEMIEHMERALQSDPPSAEDCQVYLRNLETVTSEIQRLQKECEGLIMLGDLTQRVIDRASVGYAVWLYDHDAMRTLGFGRLICTEDQLTEIQPLAEKFKVITNGEEFQFMEWEAARKHTYKNWLENKLDLKELNYQDPPRDADMHDWWCGQRLGTLTVDALAEEIKGRISDATGVV